jgi:FixJ family two-component response regulator
LAPLITIVDDDSLVRRAVLRLVESVGVEVHDFLSAEEFLQAHSLRDPDCLVLDIGLPGMSDLEMQRWLIETGRTPPIIFVTARDEAEVPPNNCKQAPSHFWENLRGGLSPRFSPAIAE